MHTPLPPYRLHRTPKKKGGSAVRKLATLFAAISVITISLVFLFSSLAPEPGEKDAPATTADIIPQKALVLKTTYKAGDPLDDKQAETPSLEPPKPEPPILKYCQASPQTGSFAHENKVELIMVQVVIRHGDRTPILPMSAVRNRGSSLLDDIQREDDWVCLKEDTKENSAESPVRFVKDYLKEKGGLFGNCGLGQLTAKGETQLQALGRSLRQKYVNDTKFLDVHKVDRQLWVRSTDTPRTLGSAKNLLIGLLSQKKGGNVYIHTVDFDYDYMTPNEKRCPALADKTRKITKRRSFQLGKKKYQEAVATLGKMYSMDGIEALALVDNMLARRCNNMPLDKDISDQLLADLAGIQAYYIRYVTSKLAPLAIGPFLSELIGNFDDMLASQQSGKTQEEINFRLYSGHDSTIGPLLSGLKIFPERDELIPYASHVELEFWKDTENNLYYIAVYYNGELMLVPGCAKQFCEYSQFKQTISDSLAPEDYEEECQEYHETQTGFDIMHIYDV